MLSHFSSLLSLFKSMVSCFKRSALKVDSGTSVDGILLYNVSTCVTMEPTVPILYRNPVLLTLSNSPLERPSDYLRLFNRLFVFVFPRAVRAFNSISNNHTLPQKHTCPCSQIFFADWPTCFSHTTHEWERTFCFCWTEPVNSHIPCVFFLSFPSPSPYLSDHSIMFCPCFHSTGAVSLPSPAFTLFLPDRRAPEVFLSKNRGSKDSWQETSMALNTLLSLLINRKLIYWSQICVCSASYNNFSFLFFCYVPQCHMEENWSRVRWPG